MRVGAQTLHGVGIDANIVQASLQAVCSALTRARATMRADLEKPCDDRQTHHL